jgi:hypothetical protein
MPSIAACASTCPQIAGDIGAADPVSTKTVFVPR